MAMSKRERNLAVLTGVLVVPFAIWMLIGVLGGSTKGLRAQKANLVNEINDAKDKIRRARDAEKKLEAWNLQSLPTDPEAASSRYQIWLLQLCESDRYNVRLHDTLVKPAYSRPFHEAGRRLTFTVRGQGSLDQLTRWLYGFYAADHLHRIKSLTVSPLDGSDRLSLDITVEALALNAAADAEGTLRATALAAVPEESFDRDLLEEYVQVITDRALFSPYQPPPPERPPDSPQPAEEPKPAAPLFDHGKYTFVTGITAVDGKPQVWLESRTSGKKLRLFEGDTFDVGPVEATIIDIRDRSIESEVEGKRYTIALGENLREAQEIDQ